MRLGDVLDEPEPPAPPAKPKRRWLAPLVAVAGVGAFLAAHGPGVTYLEGGEAAVIVGWPQDAARVASDEGLVFWLPMAQSITVVPTGPRRLRLSLTGQLRDGTPVSAPTVEISWRAKAQDLPGLVARFGPAPSAWDEGLTAAAAGAWADGLREADPATLPEAAQPLRAALARAVSVALAANGAEVQGFEVQGLRFGGPAGDALSRLGQQAQQLADLKAAAARDTQRARERTLAAQAKWANARSALVADLSAQTQGARQQAEADRAEAQRYRAEREAAGAAERDALRAQATVHAEAGRLRAQALGTRANALEAQGERVLEQAIVQHVLPQLGGPPPKAPASEAAP